MMKKSCALFLSLGLASQPAFAQDTSDTRVRVGLGAQTEPEYIGADKNEFAPLFDLSIDRRGEPFRFKSPDDSFGISLFNKDGFSIGPAANYQPGRKDKDVGADVGKVSSTIEVGGFVQYMLPTNTRLRLEIRKGMGGHKGIIGQIGADQVWRDADKWQFSVGPRVIFGNGRYMDSWFEVDTEAALATGLPVYDPGSGLKGVALASGFYYEVGGGIGLFGYGRAERLVGDAADSPIVKEYGSKSQLSAGLGLTYTFNLGN